MPVDDRFIRALTEISPDLAKQYLRQYHPTEALEEILEPMPPEPEAKPASTVEERNTDLFFEIADVLDFYPHLYNQRTYGEFLLPDGTDPPTSLGSYEFLYIYISKSFFDQITPMYISKEM